MDVVAEVGHPITFLLNLPMKRQPISRYAGSWVLMCLGLLAAPAAVLAQTDEIQVYDAAIADQGVFNVMVHSNFTPSGRKNPDYPGGIIPNHSVNGAVEWAYGVTDWMEQGLYFPVYSAYSQGRDGTLNGFKIRELFDIETGIGIGYTADSDKVTLKLMVSRDINPKAKP